jgi:type I restriction enzyme S subunit
VISTHATLGDVAEFVNGAAFKESDWTASGLRIIRIQNLTDASKPFNRTTREISNKIRVRPGDLLVSWSTTLGVFEWTGPDDAALNQHIFRVLPDDSIVDKRYLRWVLDDAVETMRRHLHGATMQHVNRAEFLSTEIYLPLLAEQRRIAKVLEEAHEIRDKRVRALGALGELERSIYSHMFDNGERTGERVPLQEAFWFQEGPGVRNWQFRDTGVKLLNVANIVEDGTLDLTRTNKYLSRDEVDARYRHFVVDEGDLVIASSGISFDDDGLLRTRGAVVEGRHLPLCMNTSTIRFKAVEGRSRLAYLKRWLDSLEFRAQISRRVTGSAQQNFGPSHLKTLLITLPPIESQLEFEARIDQVGRVRATQRAHLVGLDALVASIGNRVFRSAQSR